MLEFFLEYTENMKTTSTSSLGGVLMGRTSAVWKYIALRMPGRRSARAVNDRFNRTLENLRKKIQQECCSGESHCIRVCSFSCQCTVTV